MRDAFFFCKMIPWSIIMNNGIPPFANLNNTRTTNEIGLNHCIILIRISFAIHLIWYLIYHLRLPDMMTSSNENIFCVTCPLRGNPPVISGVPSQRPQTLSFDVFFNLHPNKRLNKQSRRRRFKTPSCSLWRHCNGWHKFRIVHSFFHQSEPCDRITSPMPRINPIDSY